MICLKSIVMWQLILTDMCIFAIFKLKDFIRRIIVKDMLFQ